MLAPLKRLLALILLLGWLAPSVAALEVALHVASEHHGPHATEHEAEIADLVRTALHGHHHDLDTTAHHDHLVLVDAQAPAVRSAVSKAVPNGPTVTVALTERSLADRLSRRAPPRPIFAAHHSLLL